MSEASNASGAEIRAAIVGCGVIGRTHSAAVREFPEIVVTALVDVVSEASEALAAKIEAQGDPRPAVFPTLAEALAAVPVDLVIVSTPSGLHIQQALEALDAGKHVVIEKPLTLTWSRRTKSWPRPKLPRPRVWWPR
ncbi:4-carboxy-2-hydroxymuconate-6-semialdehyde dehydrogenase [Arthrobacter sp. Hiyo8]|nr:4-carboxy-2-hydroxymuconate-6-semialdehyde dehydrogenase [Arthrobacter sp. Hiyo8]